MTDDPRTYEGTTTGDCPDCGPCLIDRFDGKWKCGKCGREVDR